jgi:hypothetical protein
LLQDILTFYRRVLQLENTIIQAFDTIEQLTGWKGFMCIGGLGDPAAKPGQLSVMT